MSGGTRTEVNIIHTQGIVKYTMPTSVSDLRHDRDGRSRFSAAAASSASGNNAAVATHT
jgi:hypothetical protein